MDAENHIKKFQSYQEEREVIIEEIVSITVEVKTNKGRKKLIFTDIKEPKMNCVKNEKQNIITHGIKLDGETIESYKQIIFDNATLLICSDGEVYSGGDNK